MYERMYTRTPRQKKQNVAAVVLLHSSANQVFFTASDHPADAPRPILEESWLDSGRRENRVEFLLSIYRAIIWMYTSIR